MINLPRAALSILSIIREGKLFSAVPAISVIFIIKVSELFFGIAHLFTSTLAEAVSFWLSILHGLQQWFQGSSSVPDFPALFIDPG
jgi:hypothetical protein